MGAVMPNLINLVAMRFGKLTVMGVADSVRKPNGDTVRRWSVVCDCGVRLVVNGASLRGGARKSCGCGRRGVSRNRTHGRSGDMGHSAYKVWNSMRSRCTSGNKDYRHYGGRGISVCERWKSFTNFLADMGEAPPGMQIDRIDNDGNYEPGNCRWATPTQNLRNRRSSLMVTIGGDTRCLAEWVERYKCPYNLAQSRITQLGWPPLLALTAPVGTREKRSKFSIQQQEEIAA